MSMRGIRKPGTLTVTSAVRGLFRHDPATRAEAMAFVRGKPGRPGVRLYARRVRPLVMGVLNVTPDSFFDGGRYLDHDAAIRRGREILDEGADILDIGGESTRPGRVGGTRGRGTATASCPSSRRSPSTEGSGRPCTHLDRHDEACRRTRAAVSAGATIMNDVSASLAEVAAETGAAFVAMHRKARRPTCRTTRATTTSSPRSRSTWQSARGAARSCRRRRSLGRPRHRLRQDRASTTWLLLRALRAARGARLRRSSSGTSRKTFLGESQPADRESAAASRPERAIRGVARDSSLVDGSGAAAVRVHDVGATAQAARLVAAACGAATYRDDHDLEQGDNRL